jgi:hypothetical protein
MAAAAGVALALLAAAGSAQARSDVNWSIGLSSPGVVVGVGNGYPVYTTPAPIYYAPRPVYQAPAPVYYAPPPPVYYAPPPPVYYYRGGGGYGHHHHGGHGGRGRWDR